MKRGQAIVSRVYGAYYNLLPLPDYQPEVHARLRGRLRLEKKKEENSALRHLIMVGDKVNFSTNGELSNRAEVAVESLEPRRNALLRSSVHEVHALGANLDRAVLIASCIFPTPKMGFIDRFLVSCYAGNVEPWIIFTKKDLLEPETIAAADDADPGIDPDDDSEITADYLDYIEGRIDLYRSLGYRVHFINVLDDDIEEIKSELSSGVTLLAGNSGTGKSTFINRIAGSMQKTGEVSLATTRGKHTTTNSVLIHNGDMFLIDSPGIKEWGIHHIDPLEIYAAFPEFNDCIGECEFRDCDHSEGVRGCALRKRIDDSIADSSMAGEIIDAERLKSLFAMLNSLSSPDKTRTGDYIKATGRLRQFSGTSRSGSNRKK